MKKIKLNVFNFVCGLVVILIIIATITAKTKEPTVVSVENKNSTKTSNSQLTTKEKLEDFDYLFNILKDNYPYFEVNKRVSGVDWLSNKKEYEDIIKASNSDSEFESCLTSILKQLYNGHTNVVDKDFYAEIINAYTLNGNNKPLGEVLRKPEVEKRYGYDEAMEEKKSSTVSSNNNISNNETQPLYSTNIIIPNKAAYLKVPTFMTNHPEDDKEGLYKFFQQIKDYEKLIIDIRGNGGGNTMYWMGNIVAPLTDKEISADYYLLFRGGSYEDKFLASRGFKLINTKDVDKKTLDTFPPEAKTSFKYISKFSYYVKPENPVGFKGKIYLLVDPIVFSSSEAFASFCKATKWATLIGERTGGDGIGIDPMLVSLPNSGYVVRFPTEMGLNPDGSANEEKKTEPDIEVQATIGHSYNDDICIQEALKR